MRRAQVLAGVLGAAGGLADAAAESGRPTFNNVRHEENWSRFEGGGGALDRLKRAALPGGGFATFGLDWRLKGEFIENPSFGLFNAPQEPGYGLSRLLVHGDVQYADVGRVFVQFGAHEVFERRVELAFDDNQYDLQQAFADLRFRGDAGALTLRVGRQEVVTGDPRIMNVREGANIRLRFDAARALWDVGPYRFEALAGRPTKDKQGSFDDGPDQAQDIVYARVTRRFEGGRLEAALVDHRRARAQIGGPAGPDDRLTAVVRGVRAGERWELEGGLYLQRGESAGRDVEAFGAGAEINRRFERAGPLDRLQLRVNYGSGDPNPDDRTAKTYAAPFPRGSYLNDPALLSYSNVLYVAPVAILKPTANTVLELRTDLVFRPEAADAVYAFPTTALPGTRGAGGGALAALGPAFFAVATLNRHVSVNMGAAALLAEGPLARAGGRDQVAGTAGFLIRY